MSPENNRANWSERLRWSFKLLNNERSREGLNNLTVFLKIMYMLNDNFYAGYKKSKELI